MRKKANIRTDLPEEFINELGKLIDEGTIDTDSYLVFQLGIEGEIYKIDIGMSKVETEKTCTKCDRMLPIDKFYTGITRRSGDGKECICKECRIEAMTDANKKRNAMYRYNNKIRIPKIIYYKKEEEN